MPVTSNNTVFYVDFESLRTRFAQEREIRGVSRAVIETETGIHSSILINFEKHGRAIGADTFVTIARWIGQTPGDFVKRRKSAVRHVDTPEQRQLRLAMAFLSKEGVEKKDGELVVETMIRLLTEAKAAGVLEDGPEEGTDA